MQQYCEIATPKGVMRGFFHVPHRKEFPVLLIFHGFTGQCTGTKFSYVSLSRLLEAQGVGTLRMDFLGSGESDLTFKGMTFDDELSCARILLEELKKMPQVTDIYVLGHSMGGAIASELAKIYPEDIKKLVLWAPAFCLPDALDYLTGTVKEAPVYDHSGFEISDAFVKDMLQRDFYKNLDTYKNDLLVIHGTEDKTVPYAISEKYTKLFGKQMIFHPVVGASHNYDNADHIHEVLSTTYKFLTEQVM